MRLLPLILSLCLSFSLEAIKPQRHEFAYEIDNLIFEIAEFGRVVPDNYVPKIYRHLMKGEFYLNGEDKDINKKSLNNPLIQRDIFDALSYLSHMRVIILRNMGLTEIPLKILELKNLKILVLADNPIATLPNEILDLPLESLDLTNTPLARETGKYIWTREDVRMWLDEQKLKIKEDLKFIYEALIESERIERCTFETICRQNNPTEHQFMLHEAMYSNFAHPCKLREAMFILRPRSLYEEIDRLTRLYTLCQQVYNFLFQQGLNSKEFEATIPNSFNLKQILRLTKLGLTPEVDQYLNLQGRRPVRFLDDQHGL